MLQIAMAHGGGSYHQRTIGYRFRHGFINFGVRQCFRSANGRAGIAKGYFIRVDQAQIRKSEVAQGASYRADIERIADIDQNDTQSLAFVGNGQGIVILRQGDGSSRRVDNRVSRGMSLHAWVRVNFLHLRENVKYLSNRSPNARMGQKSL